MPPLAANAAGFGSEPNHGFCALCFLASLSRPVNTLFGGKIWKEKGGRKNESETFPIFPLNLCDSGIPAEINMLQCTLNKPSPRMGYHGKGGWLSIASSGLF